MPRKYERTAVLVALVASPFLLPALPNGWGGSLRDTFLGWTRPLFETVHLLREGFGGLGSGVLEVFSLEEENKILRARLESLNAHEETHRELFRENARLRRLLDFRAKAGWKVIPAEVIGREMGPWSRGLLLDKGSQQGIREGMAVLTSVGLVGRISEAGTSSSRVALLTDPHFRVMGRLPETSAAGLVSGGPTGECLIQYLPLDQVFQEGQVVSTSGGKSFAPAGIPIGVIRKVWKDSSEMYQTARVQPAVRLGAVDEVLVVSWQS